MRGEEKKSDIQQKKSLLQSDAILDTFSISCYRCKNDGNKSWDFFCFLLTNHNLKKYNQNFNFHPIY